VGPSKDVINWRTIASGVFSLGQPHTKGPLAEIVRGYVRYLPLVAALGLVASVLETFGVGLLIPLVGLLLAEATPSGVPQPILALAEATAGLDRESRIILLGVAMAGFIVVKGLVQAANNTFIAHLDGRMGRDLRNALAARLLQLDYPFFLREDAARLTHILSIDSTLVIEAVQFWLALIPATVALLVTSAILIWLNPTLFLVALIGAGLVQATLVVMERRQGELSSELTASDLSLWNRALGVIRNVRVIRAFGQRAREHDRFASGAERYRKASLNVHRLAAIVSPTVDALLALLFVAILLIGYRTGMSVPATTAFLVLLLRAQPYAQVVSRSRVGIAGARKPLSEVDWLLSQKPAQKRLPAAARCEAIDRPINFQRVDYTYPNGNRALHEVSLSIKPGISTALIGRSGSGKTTVVNLIARLLEPETGTIRLGEELIETIDIDAWRSQIALAGQDIELVDGTVAQNIAYGRPEASRAEIVEVAGTAGAAEFIDRLPQGFETEVGEEGIRLSGGQRQRISLARALLRQPSLLILDEAMNAVDALSETEIMKLLHEHRHFRSALVVSHRKSTLAACQEGIVIEEGRVREAGPLASLTYFRHMSGEIGGDD
jgi:subfamily B ATP-binding cassette protein MsbA